MALSHNRREADTCWPDSGWPDTAGIGARGFAAPFAWVRAWLERAVVSQCRRAKSAFSSLATATLLFAALSLHAGPALALDALLLNPATDRLELTAKGQYYDGRGDQLQVDTAPGRNGLSARIVVGAATPGTNPSWMVFALTNPTTKTLERWLVASRYTLIGSGAIWPKLDAPRIEAITPSLGVIPVRVKNDQKDIFSISVPPGKTVTYVVELASAQPTRIYLWKPLSFTEKSRDSQLFNGIMLGVVGLLGIFLVAVFVANHKVIFPSAALVAWCVLAYLCVEFGFWHKLFQLRPEDNAVYRAMAESAVAASLVLFLFAFLRLSVWHGFIRMLFAVWIAAQLGLIFAAVIDPQLAATFARLSFVLIGGFGGLLALFLAFRGQDRALALIPTWLLFGVWIFGMAMAMSGRLSGDVTVSALVAGLVLLTLLIGFTVTQFAFRTSGPTYGAAPNELALRSQAIDGSGAAVWEWSARRDEVKVSPVVEMILGLNAGELSTKVDAFIKHLHPADRERLRLNLFSAKEHAVEELNIDFRMRHADNSYRWFELIAASAPGVDRNSLRCVGLMRDITDAKRAQERLTHDAVHDALTGLPNRELFLDRLGVANRRAAVEGGARPTILFIDVDKFKSINSSFGLIVGDSLLLTIARRLVRHIGPQDTLARVGGDQFALLVTRAATPAELGKLADDIRQTLRAPIAIAGQEIILTVSIGLALYNGDYDSDSELLREAEIAMYRAKRAGTDRIELFEPSMRAEKDERIAIESDLRRALEQNQLKLEYQPIMQLTTEELVGFEALVRWDHPKLGRLNPADFVPVAEETDLIIKLGSYVLRAAASQAARWHVDLPRPDNPLFVSVNVSSRQLFRQDLIQEMRHIIGQEIVPRGSLRLEVTESLVMENPEQALQMLEQLKAAGAELSMDDFGTGYSSLAYLQRFPFDTIKVDRALVQGSGEDGPEAVIIRSIVALAHELDLKVIAEGVEISQDVTFLRSIGCGFAQGFFYGEPMDEREVRKMLKIIHKSESQNRRSTIFRSKSKALKKSEQDIKPLAHMKTSDKGGSANFAAQTSNRAGPANAATNARSNNRLAVAGSSAPAALAAAPQPGRESWLQRRKNAANEKAVQANTPEQVRSPTPQQQPGSNPASGSSGAAPGSQSPYPASPASSPAAPSSAPMAPGRTAPQMSARPGAPLSSPTASSVNAKSMANETQAGAPQSASGAQNSAGQSAPPTPSSPTRSPASPGPAPLGTTSAAAQAAGQSASGAMRGGPSAPVSHGTDMRGSPVQGARSSNAQAGAANAPVSNRHGSTGPGPNGPSAEQEPGARTPVPLAAKNPNGSDGLSTKSAPTDYPTLPPAIAASLARLAGVSTNGDAAPRSGQNSQGGQTGAAAASGAAARKAQHPATPPQPPRSAGDNRKFSKSAPSPAGRQGRKPRAKK